jgi:endonuclease YncB( thermonuclease family)
MGWLSMLMNGGATMAHTMCRLSSVMAIVAMTACLTWSARAETISGRVRPMDGDTFEIAGVVIRLADVDAPEMSQKCQGGPKELRNCGAFVADVLAERIRGQAVECEVHAVDDYERRLASCSHAGEDLSTWLVSEGLALAFRRFSQRLVPEENAARAAGRGLWQTTFETPWITARSAGKRLSKKRPKAALSRTTLARTEGRSITRPGGRNGTTGPRSPNRKESAGFVTRPKRWQRDGGRR